MSQSLIIPNYLEANMIEAGVLNADLAVGATSVTVQNVNHYVLNTHLIIGRYGSEGCEMVTITANPTNATNLTTTATTLPHNRFDVLQSVFADQINIYRASNVDGSIPANASFSLLTTVQLDVDQPDTIYTDPAGNSNWWYKFTYLDSITSTESNIADATPMRGGMANYTSIQNIRRAAGFERNLNLQDDYIDTFRQSAQDTINGYLSGLYVVPFTAPINAQIAELTKRLAAARLKIDQYGKSADYVQEITDVENELKAIQQGQTSVVGATGVPEPANPVSSGGFNGWPNDTTAATDPLNGGSDFAFRRGYVDGYHGRFY